MFAEYSEIYKTEFDKRNTGGRMTTDNPAMNWQKVTAEVAELDSRNPAQGYMVYAQRRIIDGESHEQAMSHIIKNVVWR